MKKATQIILIILISNMLIAGGYGGWGNISLDRIIAAFQSGTRVTTLNIGNSFEVKSNGNVIVNGIDDAVSGGNDLQIGDGSASGSNAGMSIRSGASGLGGIYFTRGASGGQTEGYILYQQGSRALRFGTSAGERMRLDNNGNLGLGTTSPDEKFEAEWSANVDAEIGRGATDTDITFIKLRSPDGTAYYLYPADDGGSLTISATKP